MSIYSLQRCTVARSLATGLRSHIFRRASAPVRMVRTDVQRARTLSDDLKELQTRGHVGVAFDSKLLAPDEAPVFPRIKTTSLSTKTVVIADECRHSSATLVLLAFRRFASEQTESWRKPFIEAMTSVNGAPHRLRAVSAFDVTINESFGAQALSGFVQRMQRAFVDPREFDFNVAFNSKLREPIERVLPLHNRLYGYALLCDPNARIRFRAAGMADSKSLALMLDAANRLVDEDARSSPRAVNDEARVESPRLANTV